MAQRIDPKPLGDDYKRPLPVVEAFDSATVTPDDVVKALISAGGCIIRNVVAQEDLDLIEKDVRTHLNADKEWEGDFFPKETRRVLGLAAKSKSFMEKIVANQTYQEVCKKMLSSTVKNYLGQELQTSTSPPQLNNTIVFSIGPGGPEAKSQPLHRDDMIHHNIAHQIEPKDYQIGQDTGIGWFVGGKKTTRANGATRFIPGSHLWHNDTPPNEDLAYWAELNPGDAFIMLASCYHGGSANTTLDQERLVYSCFMTKGYLRQVCASLAIELTVQDSALNPP